MPSREPVESGKRRPRLVGLGYALPGHVRDNHDPVFRHLNVRSDGSVGRFDGVASRRYLAQKADLVPMASRAATNALSATGLSPEMCDVLVGRLSLGRYHSPEDLSRLCEPLGLPTRAIALPIASDHTNFLDGLIVADGLLRSGWQDTALVVAAGNWTHFVDYGDDEAFIIGDGAGSAILTTRDAPSGGWELCDWCVETRDDLRDRMYVATRPTHDGTGERAVMTFAQNVGPMFTEFAKTTPVTLAERLLARQNLDRADVTLGTHQPSAALMAAWAEAIAPHDYLDSLAELGNLDSATHPINWARQRDTISTDYLLFVGLGWHAHAHAVLLRRVGEGGAAACGDEAFDL